MVDKDGNILRQDKYHYESHNYTEVFIQKLRDSISYYKSYKDSLSKYRLKIDSLDNIKQDSVPYPIYMQKPISRIDTMFLNFGKDIAIFVVGFIIGIIILMTKKKKKT